MSTNNINIYGSTGKIGSKTLFIIRKYFPEIKINLLVANNNYKKLAQQANFFNPYAICLMNESKILKLKQK